MREEIADPQARLSPLFELPKVLQPLAIGRQRLRTFIGPPLGLFAVALREFGFRIERVHVRHAAVHEQEDHMFRARHQMGQRSAGFRARPLVRKPGEGKHAKAHAGAFEKAAPRQRRSLKAGTTQGMMASGRQGSFHGRTN